MHIHVKYFKRCVEGRKAPEDWLRRIQEDEMTNAYEMAHQEANERSDPNDMGDDWDAAFDDALEYYTGPLDAFDEQRRKKIFFQEEDVCGCCKKQLGATYPWEHDEYYTNTYYNCFGECEACVVGCCDIIEDHA